MKKVNITSARKNFIEGQPILFVPNKCSVKSKYGQVFHKLTDKAGDEFDKLCEAFKYYNCKGLRGTSIAFYLTEVEVEP